MKAKIILGIALAILASGTLYAQTKTTFGVRAGVQFYTLNGSDADGNDYRNKVKTGFNAGVNAEIPVGTDFYLQPGLLFSTKGAKSKDVDASVSLDYIEIPVNFIYKPLLGTGHMLLGFGPYAAFGVSAKSKAGNSEIEFDFGNEPGEIKRFDAGANFLAGYEFTNKLSFQINAGLGLVDIVNPEEGDNNSKLKNTGFGISLGYRF